MFHIVIFVACVASAFAAPELQVDFECDGTNTQSGFTSMVAQDEGAEVTANINGMTVSVKGHSHCRSFGGDKHDPLVRDMILLNRNGVIELAISNVKEGTHRLTMWHSDIQTYCGGCFLATVISGGTTYNQYFRTSARLQNAQATQTVFDVTVGQDKLIKVELTHGGNEILGHCSTSCFAITDNGQRCGRCTDDNSHMDLNGFTLEEITTTTTTTQTTTTVNYLANLSRIESYMQSEIEALNTKFKDLKASMDEGLALKADADVTRTDHQALVGEVQQIRQQVKDIRDVLFDISETLPTSTYNQPGPSVCSGTDCVTFETDGTDLVLNALAGRIMAKSAECDNIDLCSQTNKILLTLDSLAAIKNFKAKFELESGQD